MIEQRLAGVSASAPGEGRGDVVATLENYVALLSELGREHDAALVGHRVECLRALQARGGRGKLLFFNPAAELQSYGRLLRQRHRETEALTVELLAAAETRKMVERYARVGGISPRRPRSILP